jgi:hypothetical protein
MFPILLGLLKDGIVPQSLSKILNLVFSESSVRTAAEKELSKRLEEQLGRSSAEVLGRAVTKQVDAAMEAKPAGATVDQCVAVGTHLAKNAAVQLAQAAEILLAYPDLQAAVVRAKEKNDPTALEAARKARDQGAERVKQSLVDVARVVAGDDPKEA